MLHFIYEIDFVNIFSKFLSLYQIVGVIFKIVICNFVNLEFNYSNSHIKNVYTKLRDFGVELKIIELFKYYIS